MAVKIPQYQQSVNLDAAAQTMPRYQANDAPGKALEKLGAAITQVGQYHQRRQEQFENFQFAQRQQRLDAQTRDILLEETQNYDPGRDKPGTLHDRVMARIKPLQEQFVATTVPRLQPQARERMDTYSETFSTSTARAESAIGRTYYTKLLDSTAGTLAAGVKASPDSFDAAAKQLKQTVDGAVNIPTAQRETMYNAYVRTMAKNAVAGYAEQKRYDEGRAFVDRIQKQYDTAPPVPAIGPRSDAGDGGQINARRIAQIDAIPEAKDAIEKAAAKYGVDPNLAKVTASIESSGKYGPESNTGKYKGLFQLSPAEFGMGGGNNIYDPYQNADRGVAILARDIRNFRAANGRDPTATEVYMGHQQGPAGTNAHLANPDGAAWQNVRKFYPSEAVAKQAIWGNIPSDLKAKFGSVENVKSRDIIAIYDSKVRGTSLEAGYANTDKIAAMPRRGAAPQQAQEAPPVRADASGRIIGGVQVASADPSVGIPQQQQKKEAFKLTQLSPEDEQKFQTDLKNSNFYKEFVQKHGEQPNLNGDYDYRLLWKSGGAAALEGTRDDQDGLLHLPSKTEDGQWLKSPDHPTRWKEIFMERAGHPPESAGIENVQQANAYLAQEGKPPIEDVTPSATPQQTQGEQPTQVAGPTDATVKPVTEWGSWADSMHAVLDTTQNKAAQKDNVMKSRLNDYIKNDIASTQATGKGVQLDGELAQYFGTNQINHALIEKVAGPVKAAEWEDQRQTAQRIFGETENLRVMPADQIAAALERIRPQGGEFDFIRRQKIYNEVEKFVFIGPRSIMAQRNADPAGAADNLPEVKAALEKMRTTPQMAPGAGPGVGGEAARDAGGKTMRPNPQWTDAARELSAVRMRAQEYLGIPDYLRTPITKEEARQLAAPLLDPAQDPAATVRTTQRVIQGVMAITGGDEDAAHRALATVLQVKGISANQQQQVASALAQAGRAPAAVTQQQQSKKTDEEKTTPWGFTPQNGNPWGVPPVAPDQQKMNDGAFVPGQMNGVMAPDDIKALRNGAITPDAFNAKYGQGASDYVSSQPSIAGTSPIAVPQDQPRALPTPGENDNLPPASPSIPDPVDWMQADPFSIPTGDEY